MRRFLILIILFLSACSETPTPRPSPKVTLPPPRVNVFNPTPPPAPTVSPEPSPTLDEQPNYAVYTIPALRARTYGGGEIQVENSNVGNYQTHYTIRYPSDQLSIYANVFAPNWEGGPFPVVFLVHGSAGPGDYIDIASSIAAYGYIVIEPTLRNYSPSSSGDNLFRTGYAIDILNLIALVKAAGGQPGPFEKADVAHMGLWGHSLGGGVVLKVLTISPDIQAAILYAGISGDERKNSDFFYQTTGQFLYKKEVEAPPDIFTAVSPASYYGDITAAIQLHHGTADSVIPVAWAVENCQQLQAQQVKVDCLYYDGAEHTFLSRYSNPPYDFWGSQYAFLEKWLK